jgi:hypothetical protein
MVAHLTPTEYCLIALAESMVTWSFVYLSAFPEVEIRSKQSRWTYSIPRFHAQVIIFQIDIKVWSDKLPSAPEMSRDLHHL